jgi:hypothetical protein
MLRRSRKGDEAFRGSGRAQAAGDLVRIDEPVTPPSPGEQPRLRSFHRGRAAERTRRRASSATSLRHPPNHRAEEAASSTFAFGGAGTALPSFRGFAGRFAACRRAFSST